MTRTLTSAEVAKRLAIREAKDREPATAWDKLARQFSTGKQVVGNALEHSSAEWRDMLARVRSSNTPVIYHPSAVAKAVLP
jgi:hypothetical protein